MAEEQVSGAPKNIKLLVGGSLFETTLDILLNERGGTKNFFTGMFKSNFSPSKSNERGELVLEGKNPRFFGHILTYLETGKLPSLFGLKKRQFITEVDSYNLVPLLDVLQIPELSRNIIVQLNTELTINECMKELNLYQCHLPNIDLSGIHFKFPLKMSESYAYNSNMARIRATGNFEKADFSCSDFKAAEFTLSNFRDTNLSGANLSTTTFTQCDLRGVKLATIKDKCLDGTSFIQCTLPWRRRGSTRPLPPQCVNLPLGETPVPRC